MKTLLVFGALLAVVASKAYHSLRKGYDMISIGSDDDLERLSLRAMTTFAYNFGHDDLFIQNLQIIPDYQCRYRVQTNWTSFKGQQPVISETPIGKVPDDPSCHCRQYIDTDQDLTIIDWICSDGRKSPYFGYNYHPDVVLY